MFNASSANPLYVTSFTDVRNKDHTILAPIVTLTSVLTETVHPTQAITEAVTITRSPTTVYTEPAPSQTPHSEIDPQQNSQTSTKTKIETTPTIVDSSTSQSSTSSEDLTTWTTSSSSSLQAHEPFRTSEISVFSSSTDVHLSVADATLASTSNLKTPSSTWPSTSIMSTASAFRTMAPVETFSSQYSPTASPSMTMGSAFADPSTSTKESTGNQTSHQKVGAIVGGTVGAITFIALGLLAFFLFRRRRWTNPHRRQNSRQGLLPNRDSTSSFRGHTRKISQPYFSDKDGPACIPSAPVFPPRRNYSVPSHSDPAFGASAPSPCLEKVYPHGDGHYVYMGDPNEDLERSPSSPIIEIYPPSRSVSNYSQESGGGGTRFLDYHDESLPSSRHASFYRPGESSLTLPDTCSQASKSLGTPKTRDSIRSDPFDLEPPANVLRKGPPLPSSQSHWRFGF
ncbi:uncharacterized protein N7484_001548 [Penicillium longicatenatum]|uniref:uncharacterized protein n=1 Tax=Penicillium longicatenatum TaxID=1561947 RepID=UPI002548D58E|nr:uncharacterized protein N7484_001548 [Penicillium longicatenatum]KAJ5657899.1 hypothetical protein N7484_001548 [Penicillium longicatenatum]